MNLITDSDELRARIREASEWSDMTHVEGDLDDIINAIIAAGWQKVPEDAVCVSRSLVEFYLTEAEMEVKEHADAEGDMVIVLDSWTAARDELRAALEASRE